MFSSKTEFMVKPRTSDIRIHASDIRMTCEYINGFMVKPHTRDIRVTYGWRASTYEWHTDDIRVHTSDMNDVRVITSTYDWHANNIRNIKLYNEFGAFRSLFSKLFVLKTLLYAKAKRFWWLGCSYSHTFS